MKVIQSDSYKDRIKGGLAKGRRPSDYDAKSLEEGTSVEKEHTTDKELAREIAMDHLEEDADYYKKLREIERY